MGVTLMNRAVNIPTRAFAALAPRPAALLLLLALSACSSSYRVSVEPPDAVVSVNNLAVTSGRDYAARGEALVVSARREGYEDFRQAFPPGGFLFTQDIQIRLKKQEFAVKVEVIEGKASYVIDGELEGATPFQGVLEYGPHTLVLKGPDLPELSAAFEVRGEGEFVFRLQPEALPVRALGVFPCGSQPKQVIFSPDDRFLFIPLLNDEGFQVFDFEKREMLPLVKVGPKSKLKAFPEGLFIEKYQAFFVSQMSTNRLFEFGYDDHGGTIFRRSLSSGGAFPKFMDYSEQHDLLAVSNWVSDDVALIDYASGKVTRRIPGLTTPRGLAFSPDGAALFIASYEGGNFFRYDAASWRETHRFYRAGGAMRHIALDPERKRVFVDDMAHFVVFELDADNLSLIHSYKTAHHPNTIDLDSSGRYLFVSCRGPNDKVHYTNRSPENGKVMIFDTEQKTLIATIRGGNQPTGLDVSHDGRFLVFTNFMDKNFEIYDITPLTRAER